MVIAFSTAPVHIQKIIVEKMDFYDFLTFQSSSKLGWDWGKTAKVTMEVGLSLTGGQLLIKNRVRRNHYSLKKKNPAYPRFLIEEIDSNGFMTIEQILEAIKYVEEGLIAVKKTKISFQSPRIPLDLEIYNKFLKVFNVVTFKGSNEFDGRYLKNHKFEKILLPNLNSIENLCALNAPSIKIYYGLPNMGIALNQFFKEWFYDERKIRSFSIDDYYSNISTMPDTKELFSGLPFTLLWSPRTHHSSCLARLPEHHINNWFSQSIFFYGIGDESKKLYIQIGRTHFKAREVADPQRELFSLLHPKDLKKLKEC